MSMDIPYNLSHSLAEILNKTPWDQAAEAIEAKITEDNWPDVQAYLLDLLLDDPRPEAWQVAAEVLWQAVVVERPMLANLVIAHLYFRFDPDTKKAEDLAWSITATLKNLHFQSDYSPLDDPGVMAILGPLKMFS